MAMNEIEEVDSYRQQIKEQMEKGDMAALQNFMDLKDVG